MCHFFQMDRFNYLADMLLTRHHPVLFVGDPGVGKSALMEVCFQTIRALDIKLCIIADRNIPIYY